MSKSNNRYFVSKDTGEIFEVTSQDALIVFDSDYMKTQSRSPVGVRQLMLEAAENPQAMICDLIEMIEFTEDAAPPSITDVAAAHIVDVDQTIEKYAGRLEQMYNKKTAGDYSFHGVLACFLMELEGK